MSLPFRHETKQDRTHPREQPLSGRTQWVNTPVATLRSSNPIALPSLFTKLCHARGASRASIQSAKKCAHILPPLGLLSRKLNVDAPRALSAEKCPFDINDHAFPTGHPPSSSRHCQRGCTVWPTEAELRHKGLPSHHCLQTFGQLVAI